MDGRPTLTDCDKAGDYVVPNVLSPRDLVFRPVPHTFLSEIRVLSFKVLKYLQYFLLFHR